MKITKFLIDFRCDKSRMVGGVKIKCNFKLSMKKNTWLKGSHLPLKKTLQFISMWLTLPYPRHELLKSELAMSSETIVDHSNFCREICMNSLVMNCDNIIGGEGTIVEIDEAKIGKRKYIREVASWELGFWGL